MKICRYCNENKESDEFRKNNFNKDGLYSYCRECNKAYSETWRNANREKTRAKKKETYKNDSENLKFLQNERRKRDPDKKRESLLKNKYNIDLHEYNIMLENQNGVCAICKNPETVKDYRTGNVKFLSVDHDGCLEKLTGEMRVRGLLCTNCNGGLGHFKDNKDFLKNAISYIIKSSKNYK